MKHNEHLCNAIGGIDAAIVAAAAPGKHPRRALSLRRAIPLAACLALAVIIGVAAWRMNTPEIKHTDDPHYSAEADTNALAGIESVPATEHELAIVRRWEEMRDPERFTEFTVGENSYHTRVVAIDAAQVGERLGEAAVRGYDIYTDSEKSATLEYFAIRGISTDCVLAVRFPGSEEYYSYVNYWYRPETLEDLISVLNLRESMTFGDFHANYFYEDGCYEQVTFHDPDDSIVWEQLLSDTALPNVWEDTGWYTSILSISVRIPLLGRDMSIWITEDGYLCTNIMDTGKAFYIGEEKVAQFIQYVVMNCTDRTVTVQSVNKQQGAQTTVEDDDGIVEMTTQGYNPDAVQTSAAGTPVTAAQGRTTAAAPYLPGEMTSPAYTVAFTTSEE